ncbi:hypothetical protein FA13DRAFT_174559 [Coprinellus micaceus]|uniref:Uncharacterized protein n=1 Tax=Coprinellus micaceus TaxID=71717 RepID=A0A4Y7SG69_COPMI|nr:hypothetical protein FA13DRAFT_174559 [Coprinellus micaceus]
MSSAPPTPSRQPSRSSSMWKAVRRATLLGGGAGSKESSRPGTPAGGSSTNLALPESATAPATATPSKDAADKDGGGSGSKDGNGNGNGNNGGGKKPEDDDAASIKSGKSSKGSLAGRFLSRSGSVSSLRNLGRRKSMDTSSKQQAQQPSALNTSTGGLAPPTAANPAVAGLMVPSPIAESPNREAMETAPFVAPGSLPTTSPLAHEVSRGSEADSLPQPVSGSGRSSASDRGGTESPTGYVHPPLLDSAAGNPGAFTDDSDMLPQPVVIADPYGVAGRSRSRVDLSVPPAVPESSSGGEGEGSESLPNPHEQRESSLPNPHEEGVGAPRGLEGGPSVSAVSTAATNYGVEVERSGGGREAPPFLRGDGGSSVGGSEDGGLVESPSSHTGFAAAVEGHAALARGKGGVDEGEGYGYGSGMRDGKGTEERGKEPTLPAYSETGGQGEGQWDGYVGSSSPSFPPFYSSSSFSSATPSSFSFWPFSSLFAASSSTSTSPSSSSPSAHPTRSHPRPSHPSSSTTTADGHPSTSSSSGGRAHSTSPDADGRIYSTSSSGGRLPPLDVNGPLDVHGHTNGDAKASPYPYTAEDAGVYTLFLYLFCIVLYLFYGAVYVRLNPGWY